MKSTLIVCTLVLFGYTSISAGVVYEIETTYHGERSRTIVSVEGDVVNIKSVSSDGTVTHEVTFYGSRNEFIVIDHGDKSYYVMDDATMQRIAGQAASAQSQLDQVIKNLPKEQREAIEKARQQGVEIPGIPSVGAQPKEEYRRTGERAVREGYPCVKYEVLRGGQKIRELWVTDWSNVEGSNEARPAFEKMSNFLGELMDSMQRMSGPGGGIFGGNQSSFMNFQELDDFPIITRDFDGNELESESILRSATYQTLDVNELGPRAGYKRRSMGPQ